MPRFFSHGVYTSALISVVLSCTALAQKPVRTVAPEQPKTPPATALRQRFKSPAELSLIPWLQKQGRAQPASALAGTPKAAASTIATPNFGGYVNAPFYSARNTASLAGGIFDTGVTAEVEADFNKDGKPDIAVLQEDGTLNILSGDGAGNLSAPVSYLNPNQQTTNIFVAYAADINGDGAPDVVAFDYANNTLITWLNLGSGQFNAAVTTLLDTTNGYASIVYLGDLNGDGKADLVYPTTVSQSRTSTTIALETQLGNGDGTFAVATSAGVQTLTVPYSVTLPQTGGIATADLNRDGKLDLVLALPENYGSGGNWVLETLLGKGDGTFSTFGAAQALTAPAVAGVFAVSFDTSGIYIADVNGDGTLDVVTDLDGTVYAATGVGDGTFNATVASSSTDPVVGPGTSALVDVNGDGKADFVTAGGTMLVMLSNGDGTFAAPTATQQYVIDPAGAYSLLVADFNGDGRSDVAQLGDDYKEVALFFGDGATGFRGAPLVTAAGDPLGIDTELVASGTYTHSGYSDPLFLYEPLTGGTGYVYTGVTDGKGNFASVQALAGGIPSDLEFVEPVQADLNNDGLEDLVYANTTGDIYVALSKGDGTFTTPASIGIPAQQCPEYYAAAGDLNGDGFADLVIPYGSDVACGSQSGGASGYWIALGKGDGTFQAPVFNAFGTELYSVTLADMNADGRLDLLINDVPFISGFGYQVSYLPGNGDGTFGSASVLESSYVVSSMATADINGDGKLDLVLSEEEVVGSDTSTGGIVTIAGNGDGTFGTPVQVANGNFFYGLQVADINNDGNADIVATLYQTLGQPVTYYGMITLLGYGNGEFAPPANQLESLGSQLPLVGHYVNDGAFDVMTETGYGPALFAGQGGSTLSLAGSSSAINFGDSETLTATVAAALSGRPSATGTVTFYDGATVLGTAALHAGTATYATSTLAAGSHSLTAVYGGDANYNPNTSAALPVAVATLAPAFTLASSSGSVSLTPGAQGVVTLSLAANATFSGSVALTCSGAPANSTCTVNPGSATLTPGGTTTATVVIGTTGTSTSSKQTPASPLRQALGATSLAALGGAFLARRKRLSMLAALGLSVLFFTGAGALTGCGGSGETKVATASAGSYTLTITATPATGTAGTTQTTTINVTVQ